MKEILFRFYKTHIESTPVKRAQRHLVLAVKYDAGTLTIQDRTELEILQSIRIIMGELSVVMPCVDNDLFWPQRA